MHAENYGIEAAEGGGGVTTDQDMDGSGGKARVYEEEDVDVEPFNVYMQEAWTLQRFVVIHKGEKMSEYKSLDGLEDKIIELRNSTGVGIYPLSAVSVVKPYGKATKIMACNSPVDRGKLAISRRSCTSCP